MGTEKGPTEISTIRGGEPSAASPGAVGSGVFLQDCALGLLGLGHDGPRVQHGTGEGLVSYVPLEVGKVGDKPNGLVEDAFKIPLCQGRAFEVLVCPDLLGAQECLVVGYGLHSLLSQRLESRGILSQIELCAHQDNGDVGRMVVNFGEPLCLVSISIALGFLDSPFPSPGYMFN